MSQSGWRHCWIEKGVLLGLSTRLDRVIKNSSLIFLCPSQLVKSMKVHVSISLLLIGRKNVWSLSDCRTINRNQKWFSIMLDGHRSSKRGSILGYNWHCSLADHILNNQLLDFFMMHRFYLNEKLKLFISIVSLNKFEGKSTKVGRAIWAGMRLWKHGGVHTHTILQIQEGQHEILKWKIHFQLKWICCCLYTDWLEVMHFVEMIVV